MRVLQPSRARLLAAVVTVATAALMSASSAFAWTSSAPLLSGQPLLNPNPFGYSGWYTGPVTVTYTFEQKGFDPAGLDHEFFETMTCSGTDGGPPRTYNTNDVVFDELVGVVTLTQDGIWDTSCAGSGEYSRLTICGFLPCLDVGTFTFGRERNGIRIDRSPPIDVAFAGKPAANINGWHNSPFTLTISGEDPTSGIIDCRIGGPVYGPLPPLAYALGYTVNSDTANGEANGGCTNGAGLRAFAETFWKYDATKPGLSPTISPSSSLLRGEAATVDANATDDLSRIWTSSCEPVDTSTIGSFAATCTATDRAGNTDTASAPYTVGLGFTGFAQPVENDALNTAKAGRGIPLKFSVYDASGPVTDLTAVSVTSTSHSCETSSGTDTVEEYAAGSSGLQNLGGGNYQFNWQTDKNYADSCRQVNINLGDNIPHTARFMFN